MSGPLPKPSASPLGRLLDTLPTPAARPRPAPSLGDLLDATPSPAPTVPKPSPSRQSLKTPLGPPVPKKQPTMSQLLAEERAKLENEVWPTHLDVAGSGTVAGMLHNIQVPVRYPLKVLGEGFNTVNRALQTVPGVQPAIEKAGAAWKAAPDYQVEPDFYSDTAAPPLTPRQEVQMTGRLAMPSAAALTPDQRDPRRAGARAAAEAELYADPRDAETGFQAAGRALLSPFGLEGLADPRVPTIGESLTESSGSPTLGMLLDGLVPLGPLAAAGKLAKGIGNTARFLANPAIDFDLAGLELAPKGAPPVPRPPAAPLPEKSTLPMLANLRARRGLAELSRAEQGTRSSPLGQLLDDMPAPAPAPRLHIPEAAPAPKLRIPEAAPGPQRLHIPEAAPAPKLRIPEAAPGPQRLHIPEAASPLGQLLDQIPEVPHAPQEAPRPPLEAPAPEEPRLGPAALDEAPAAPAAPPAIDPAQKMGQVLRNASIRLGFDPGRLSRKVGYFTLAPGDVKAVFAGTGKPEHFDAVAKALGMDLQAGTWVPPTDARRLKAATRRNWDQAAELARAFEVAPPPDPIRTAPLRTGQKAAQANAPAPYREPTFWDPGSGVAPSVRETTQPLGHRPGIMSEHAAPPPNWEGRGRGPGPRPRSPEATEGAKATYARLAEENAARRAEVAQAPPRELAGLEENLPPGVTREVVDPRTIHVDAKTYQFKGGGDSEGVTEALQGVENWDPSKANSIIVHERLNGDRYVADGHQRTGLARRLAEQGKHANINALVYREADGYTPEAMRVIGAAVNLAQNSGSAIDAAKVIRAFGEDSPHLADIPRSSVAFKDGRGLAKLAEPAFEQVVNEAVPPWAAAHVGRLISDPAEQVGAMKALARIDPKNSAQALSIVQDIRAQGMATRTEQGGLFGAEHFAEDLLGERAKIFDAAEKLAKGDKSLFRHIESGAGTLEQAGNVLARDANRERITDAERVLAGLGEAKYRGPVGERLNQLARELKAGRTNATAAARSFLESVRSESEVAGAARVQAREAAHAPHLGGVEPEHVPDIAGQDTFFSREQGSAPKRTAAEREKRLYYLTARLKNGYPLTAAEQVERTALLHGEEAAARTQDLAGQGGLFGDLPQPKKATPKPQQGGLFDDAGQGTFFSADQPGARAARRRPQQGKLGFPPEPKPPELPPARPGRAAPDGQGRLVPDAPKGPGPTESQHLPAPYEVMGQKVQFGHVEVSRRLPMVGLVKLMRSWTGQVPTASKALAKLSERLRTRINGKFDAKTGQVHINADLFADEDAASKVLGHEIGHVLDLVDGPVAGQVKVMKSELGKQLGKNADLYGEALELSKEWRPYDPHSAPADFLRYREAPEELIADYLSTFFNDAELAAKKAPKLTQAFYASMDKRPKLLSALLDAYDLTDGTLSDFAGKVAREVDTSFMKAEDLWRAMREERTAREGSMWKRMADQVRYLLSDVGGEAKRRAQARENMGALNGSYDPRISFDEGGYSANRVYIMAQDWQAGVVEPLQKAGASEEDLGTLLFAERIANGDRSALANPRGVTAKNATQILAEMKAKPEYKVLKKAAEAARELYWKALEEAVDAGVVSREAFDQAKANKHAWADFALVDDLHKRMSADIEGPGSTFGDIANPSTATFMRAVATRNLAESNRARAGMVEFMQANYPEEIVQAKQGDRIPYGQAEFHVLEDGRRVTYHVDKWLSDMFDGNRFDEVGQLARTIAFLDNKAFKPLWIGWNLGFQTMNVLRDAQRTTRSFSALGVTGRWDPRNFFKTLGSYWGAKGHAYAYAKGEMDGLLRQMVEDYALAPPGESMTDLVAGDTQMQAMLRQHGALVEPPDRSGVKAILKVGDLINGVGRFLEAVPKVAGYQRLGQAGITGAERAHIVRTYVGTPNFKIKGAFTKTTNSVYIFSNIALQSWKADLHLLTAPRTRGAAWAEIVKHSFMPKLLMAAGAYGLYGSDVQQLFDGISEYDKTQFLCIPMGSEEGGEHGQRTRFLRLPLDETARFFGGLLWKAANAKRSGKDLEDLFSDTLKFTVGQFKPNLGPTAKIVGAAVDVASGKNPEDDFYGRPIIRQKEFEAGGTARWKGFLKWTVGQGGMFGEAIRGAMDGGGSKQSIGWGPTMIPGLNRFLRVSDRGFAEAQEQEKHNQGKAKAKLKLGYGSQTTEVYNQYYRLQKIGKDNRTRTQEQAYQVAKEFVNRAYNPTQQNVQGYLDGGHELKAAQIQANLEKASEKYFQRLNQILGREER